MSIKECCCLPPNPPGRRLVGVATPLIAILVLTIFAILILSRSSATSDMTAARFGYMLIGAGAASYLLYLSQQATQIGPDHGLGWYGFLGLGIILTPFIVLGAFGVTGNLSLHKMALGVAIVSGVLFVPISLGCCGVGCALCCSLMDDLDGF